ncbi:regulator of G-protein signaling 13 isoform X1 [Macaca thibetana thibetana]|uniref:Regulator of G protein signaling 13 n=1 Tax=Macaca fascicularis TaxID=9541 RepID=A0A7N9D8B0_MACFA|nr:regulator of G-protein signaling 13 isoform X1 [Macaca thibetana thibetana]XP_050639041.1 regulator of G-protein signaling 13 isoform X1 [Macaca thibetana thibetana]XP_050639052.1 regulator of G-protein signaling 13 isoform X1 [Macaca thibetana thibetana]XP_050639062.1 regulator of G-protein signaling 13 isoform X1 [Macaca thibetana thibetana]
MSRRNCWICKVFRDESKRPPSNLTLEEVLQWAQSFENLMATKYHFPTSTYSSTQPIQVACVTDSHSMIHRFLSDGPVVYAAYLKMEHSDENIQFWMACETYKKIASRWSRTSRAKKLYKIYIQPQSPREINIDNSTRQTIIKNIQEPTETCFEEAQKIVYMHMERDSYPRFLKSEMYQKLLKTMQSNNSF